MECMHTWLHQRCFKQVRGTASLYSLTAKEIQTFLPQTVNLYFSDKYHPLYSLKTSCRNFASLQHFPTTQGLKYFRWQQKFNGIGGWAVSNCFVHHLYIFFTITFPFFTIYLAFSVLLNCLYPNSILSFSPTVSPIPLWEVNEWLCGVQLRNGLNTNNS